MYLKSDAKSLKAATCICGKEACKDIAAQFRAYKDVRGLYVKVPNPSQKNLAKGESEYRQQCEFWTRRLCHHHKLDYGSFRNDVCYNKPVEKGVMNTRSMKESQGHKRAMIARWHYPIPVLKEYHKPSNMSIPTFIPIEKAKDLGVFNAQGGSQSYSALDVLKLESGEELVALIPNFVDVSSVDLEGCKKGKEMEDAGTVCM